MFDVYSGAELNKAVVEAAEAAEAVDAGATKVATDSLMPSDLSGISDITALASNPFAQAQALANPTNLLQGISDPTALLQGKAQALANPLALAQGFGNPAALAKGFSFK